MVMRGFTRRFKPLEMLTQEQVELVHKGTLDVLEETGIRIESEKGLKFLEKKGCDVDYSKKRAHFPRRLVEEFLRECPSSFHIKARDPKNDLIIGGDTVYFLSFTGMKSVDLDTYELRTPTRKDNCDGVTILDALDNLHLLCPYCPYFGWEGLPSVMAIPESFACKMRNSTKVQHTPNNKNSEIWAIEMAKAVGTEFIGNCAVSPPLTIYSAGIESAFRIVEAGYPIFVGSGTMMGGTGPATIAGSEITSNAETMAAVVLAQLIKPGTRVIVWDFTFPQNMRTGAPAFGQIGVSLHQAVFNQIWRKYEIPTCDYAAGGPVSGKEIDFQCGYEKAIGALTAAVSGANVVALHGGIHGELAFHPLQAILDDDIAGMVGRFIEGVEVNDETLAIDLIKEVGPIPGHYLNKGHTRKWWKKEQFVPKAADRLTYPEWMKTGRKNCIDYAKERMEEILAKHKVSIPLTEEQDEKIENTLDQARKYYKEKGMM